MQPGRLIVGNPGISYQADVRGGAVILETDHATNIDLINRYIAVAIGDSHNRLNLACQADGLIKATAANRMLKRHVLGQTQRTVGTDGDSKCGLAGISTAHDATYDQCTFKMQSDAVTICGT